MLINDAINVCLRYIGETPVPDGVDIDSLDPLHEARASRDMLIEMSKELQSTGWYFNKEEWTYIPDVANRIGIPPNVLSLTSDEEVIKRGGSLYDVKNKTYEFTRPIDTVTVFEWDFEDLDDSFARWVTYSTAQQVQIFFNGDDYIDRDLQNKINKALIRVQRDELKNADTSLIAGSRLVDRESIPTAVS